MTLSLEQILYKPLLSKQILKLQNRLQSVFQGAIGEYLKFQGCINMIEISRLNSHFYTKVKVVEIQSQHICFRDYHFSYTKKQDLVETLKDMVGAEHSIDIFKQSGDEEIF